jgi:bifunctional DNase/RNase
MQDWEQAITAYQQGIEMEKPEIVDLIKTILDENTNYKQKSSIHSQSEIFQMARA